mmetsp:Transcript_97461/g.231954  ORF Transcript_97461/g.231954 Transcript_97461/m.231954 type:complete len:90 (-) Transcript_97461:910-1179(-)
MALPAVSIVTARPLTMARSAGPAALFVKTSIIAACDKQADVASKCATLAVSSVVQNGNQTENMMPKTLTMMEVHRPPSLVVNLGKTKEK